MPAKPLSPEQKQDAARLKTAFETFQTTLRERGDPFSQESLAEVFQLSQSTMSQYINGSIPLNADALRKFAQVMNVDPLSISPSISAKERERAVFWNQHPVADVGRSSWPFKRIAPNRIAALDSDQRAFMEGRLLALLEDMEAELTKQARESRLRAG
ncbi:MAG: XRE family transcriptional regulator [Rubrivivax sp.]|nr:MAG: XRE family transcriptional regulator [Rubrivivax sp.]